METEIASTEIFGDCVGFISLCQCPGAIWISNPIQVALPHVGMDTLKRTPIWTRGTCQEVAQKGASLYTACLWMWHSMFNSWAQATRTIFNTRPNHPQTMFDSQARESSRFFEDSCQMRIGLEPCPAKKRYRKSHRIKMSIDESISHYVWHVMTYKCTETSWLCGCDSSTSIARIGAFDPNSAWYFDQGRAT